MPCEAGRIVIVVTAQAILGDATNSKRSTLANLASSTVGGLSAISRNNSGCANSQKNVCVRVAFRRSGPERYENISSQISGQSSGLASLRTGPWRDILKHRVSELGEFRVGD